MKKILMGVASGALLLGLSVPAMASERHEWCENHVRKAEQNLRHAERKHGSHSRQAQKRRHELEEVRERCR